MANAELYGSVEDCRYNHIPQSCNVFCQVPSTHLLSCYDVTLSSAVHELIVISGFIGSTELASFP